MKPALLLVDLQRDYLASPELQPPADTLIARAAALLEQCRQRRLPVIHIWTTVRRDSDERLPHWRRENRWQCVAGTPGHEPPEVLSPKAGEAIIHKTGFNAFARPELDGVLRNLGCDTVIVAGLHLHACVRGVAVECLERGLTVRVAEDVVASNDPIHAAAVRRWLAERCVSFEPGNTILARCGGAELPNWIHYSPRQSSEALFEVPIAGADEVSSATQAARTVWAKWRQTETSARLRLLDDIARRLESAAPELAGQMALDLGKPVKHGLEEARRAAASVRDVARRAAARPALEREAAGFVRHQPLGVVGVISAWNNPVAIPLGKLAPALAYGNTAVWKPAPAATRISQSLMRLFADAGLPADTVRMLAGDHTTAQRLAESADISAVTHTGSLQSGRVLQEICARRLVPLQAELSGNNAAIVWDDADLTAAAAQVAWGAFAFGGQRCTANRRVIVHAPLLEKFLRALESATARLAWGDPLEDATEIGPLINTHKRDELASLVSAAEADGAATRVIRFHQNRAGEAWVQAGAFAPPVIACCGRPAHVLVQQETMSPLLVVQRAEDFDHAVALCNGVRHGLAAALFSADAGLQRRFLDEAQAGILKFNTSTAGVDVALPFGGWKASGLGPPEHGVGDPLFHTRPQAVYGVTV